LRSAGSPQDPGRRGIQLTEGRVSSWDWRRLPFRGEQGGARPSDCAVVAMAAALVRTFEKIGDW
jgi:hypothetical protein